MRRTTYAKQKLTNGDTTHIFGFTDPQGYRRIIVFTVSPSQYLGDRNHVARQLASSRQIIRRLRDGGDANAVVSRYPATHDEGSTCD